MQRSTAVDEGSIRTISFSNLERESELGGMRNFGLNTLMLVAVDEFARFRPVRRQMGAGAAPQLHLGSCRLA
jgi:hypothetical protein